MPYPFYACEMVFNYLLYSITTILEVSMLNQLSQEEKYYIIGLFQGDASHSENTRNRGKVQLEISLKDADLVHKLESILSKIVKVYVSSRERSVIFKTGQQYLHTSIILSIYD